MKVKAGIFKESCKYSTMSKVGSKSRVNGLVCVCHLSSQWRWIVKSMSVNPTICIVILETRVTKMDKGEVSCTNRCYLFHHCISMLLGVFTLVTLYLVLLYLKTLAIPVSRGAFRGEAVVTLFSPWVLRISWIIFILLTIMRYCQCSITVILTFPIIYHLF